MFKHATVGGTFDHLHKGHKAFLKNAFESAKKVSIALTIDTFAQKKYVSRAIQPYEVRKKELTTFLQNNNYPVIIIALEDEIGFSRTDATLDSIVVTKETKRTAFLINKLRKQKKLPTLAIIEVPFVKGTDRKIIRSTRIRKGEIDRMGRRYYSPRLQTKLLLPGHLRGALRVPLGDVVKTEVEACRILTDMKPTLTITVGDVVSNSIPSDLSIIDFKTQRKLIKGIKNPTYMVVNAPGTLHPKAVALIKQKIDAHIRLTVNGEEDLLALPAVLFAPLHAVVIYGQQDVGIVIVEVTEEKKEKVRKIINQFSLTRS